MSSFKNLLHLFLIFCILTLSYYWLQLREHEYEHRHQQDEYQEQQSVQVQLEPAEDEVDDEQEVEDGEDSNVEDILTSCLDKRSDFKLLIFTTLPGTDDKLLSDNIRGIALNNNFKVEGKSELTTKFILGRDSMEDLHEIIPSIAKPPCPKLVVYSWYFVDFERWGMKKAIHFSLFRNPLEAAFITFSQRSRPTANLTDCLSGRYPLSRCKTNPCIATSLYCGLHEDCANCSSKAALQRAKSNVETEYFFIGLADRWDDSVKILRWLLPRFFSTLPEEPKKPKPGKSIVGKQDIERYKHLFANDLELEKLIEAKFSVHHQNYLKSRKAR